MSFFDLDPLASRNVMDQARAHPLDPASMQPGWFSGAWKAPVTGLASVVNDAALLLGDAAAPTLQSAARPVDQLFGTKIEDYLIKDQQKAVDNIKEWAPDPRTTGIVGQMVHGLFNVVPEAILGGPETAAVLQGYKGYRQGMVEGLDPNTALGKGAIDAISTFAGLKIPMTLAPKLGAAANVGLGAGANVATGMVTRGATGSFLRERGYADMADQYQVLDNSAIAVDLLMGGGFGALAHYGPGAAERINAWRTRNQGKIQPTDIDTALNLNNQAHVELDTAPGIPTNPATRAAHVDGVNKALESLLKGEPVNVPPEVVNGDFLENPSAVETRQQIMHVVEDHLGPEWQVFQEELRRRGLPTDEIDTSGAYKAVPGIERTPIEVPHAALGGEASVKIEGAYHPVRWALVDADTVEASMKKGDNQFRDRGRAASEAQISKIASEPDFNLLGHSPIMDFGAPTMTAKGQIIGGNGRFAGVSKAYSSGTADAYHTPLMQNLSKFGIDPATAAGMKKPVLVRILESNVDVQRAAMASNEGAGLRMSALEQAKVDGIRLGDITGLTISDTGEIASAANHSYIKQWVGQFPTTEAAALVDKNGQLSVEGTTRLRNAVLFRAYGDSPTLARLVESTDPGARNVASALLRTAPAVAEAKAAIESGNLFPLDISQDVAAAIETLDGLRRNGLKVSEYLAQGDIFGAELSPEGRTILQFFGENMRSVKAMSDMIASYYEHLKEAGDPNQGNMFGLEAPSKQQLLEAAVKDTGKTLTPGMAELPFGEDIGVKLDKRIAGDFKGVAEEYASLKDSNGGQILNTDIARELSPEYRADRTRSADVHEAASAFVKKLYAEKLAKPTPKGKEPTVVFTGGGTGAGKSTGLKLLGNEAKNAEIIYDTNMNKMESSVQKIEQALEAGREVMIVYTFRDPVEALTSGALKRAMRMEQEMGTGRTVPLAEHAKTHIGAREVIDQLAAKYADDPRVAIKAIDNSLGEGSARVVPVAEIPTLEYNEIERRLQDATQEEHRAGRISDAVYRGTTGQEIPAGARRGDGAGDGRQSERNGQGPGAEGRAGERDAYSPDAIIAENPTMPIPSDDGGIVTARDAYAAADAEIATAKQDSQGFDAAVACALRG